MTRHLFLLVVLASAITACGSSSTSSSNAGGGAGSIPGTATGGGGNPDGAIGQTNGVFTYQVSLNGTVSLSGSFTVTHDGKKCADAGNLGIRSIKGNVGGTGVAIGDFSGSDVTGGAKSGTFKVPADSGWSLEFDPDKGGDPTKQYTQQTSSAGADSNATGTVTINADGSGKIELNGWHQTEKESKLESGTFTWTCADKSA